MGFSQVADLLSLLKHRKKPVKVNPEPHRIYIPVWGVGEKNFTLHKWIQEIILKGNKGYKGNGTIMML